MKPVLTARVMVAFFVTATTAYIVPSFAQVPYKCAANCDGDPPRPSSPSYQAPAMDINRREGTRLNDLGVAASNMGNFKRAVESYQQALRYLPNDTVIRNNLRLAQSQFLNDLGIKAGNEFEWSKAYDYYNAALQFDPKNKFLLSNVAQAEGRLAEGHARNYRKDGNIDRAIELWSESIENYKEAIRLAKNLEAEIGLKAAKYELAIVKAIRAEAAGRYTEALDLYLEAEPIAKRLKDETVERKIKELKLRKEAQQILPKPALRSIESCTAEYNDDTRRCKLDNPDSQRAELACVNNSQKKLDGCKP